MVGSAEFKEGDELNHSKHGEVTVRGVTEELGRFMITDTGDKTVFEGGDVRETSVMLEKADGVIVHEPMSEFIDEFM